MEDPTGGSLPGRVAGRITAPYVPIAYRDPDLAGFPVVIHIDLEFERIIADGVAGIPYPGYIVELQVTGIGLRGRSGVLSQCSALEEYACGAGACGIFRR